MKGSHAGTRGGSSSLPAAPRESDIIVHEAPVDAGQCRDWGGEMPSNESLQNTSEEHKYNTSQRYIHTCTNSIIRDEPERARIHEKPEAVYIYNIIYIYLLVSDLAWQRPNAHAQSPRDW